jgi:hypothetical protein
VEKIRGYSLNQRSPEFNHRSLKAARLFEWRGPIPGDRNWVVLRPWTGLERVSNTRTLNSSVKGGFFLRKKPLSGCGFGV